VNTRAVLHLVSYLLVVLAMAMGVSWLVAVLHHDPLHARRALLLSAGVTALVGAISAVLTRGPIEFSRRDGFGIVTLGWLSAALFGALPYLLSHDITSPLAAVFETMSGFTTTGATALGTLEDLPKGILFWRALTQWLGGMGVLVLCVAILPFLGVGGMQIYRAEMPGPSKDRLTPRIATTAKFLWGVYLLLSVVQCVLLRLGHMSWYDAVCHTFTTMSTGGFSTRTASVGVYQSAYLETVIIVFMFLAGVNFALHYRALLGQPVTFLRDPEFRAYTVIWLLACLFLTFELWGSTYATFTGAMRAAFFQATSIMTTTGYCTADFDLWSSGAKLVLVLLMFIGGCAGSTAGGIKVVRVFVIIKKSMREMRIFMRPTAIFQVKLGGKVVEKEVVDNISAFFIIFVIIFAAATIAMTFFTPDLETAATAVIATLGNVGPGLGGVGPMRNFAEIPGAGKAILTACMLLGRLELYTVLVLFFPGFWRK